MTNDRIRLITGENCRLDLPIISAVSDATSPATSGKMKITKTWEYMMKYWINALLTVFVFTLFTTGSILSQDDLGAAVEQQEKKKKDEPRYFSFVSRFLNDFMRNAKNPFIIEMKPLHRRVLNHHPQLYNPHFLGKSKSARISLSTAFV